MFKSVTDKLNEKLPHGLVMFITLILFFAMGFSFYVTYELDNEVQAITNQVRAITSAQKTYGSLSTFNISAITTEKIDMLNVVIKEKNQEITIAYTIGIISGFLLLFFIPVFKLKIAAFNELKNKDGKMECSECKELVIQGAKVCKHCGHKFPN